MVIVALLHRMSSLIVQRFLALFVIAPYNLSFLACFCNLFKYYFWIGFPIYVYRFTSFVYLESNTCVYMKMINLYTNIQKMIIITKKERNKREFETINGFEQIFQGFHPSGRRRFNLQETYLCKTPYKMKQYSHIIHNTNVTIYTMCLEDDSIDIDTRLSLFCTE